MPQDPPPILNYQTPPSKPPYSRRKLMQHFAGGATVGFFIFQWLDQFQHNILKELFAWAFMLAFVMLPFWLSHLVQNSLIQSKCIERHWLLTFFLGMLAIPVSIPVTLVLHRMSGHYYDVGAVTAITILASALISPWIAVR